MVLETAQRVGIVLVLAVVFAYVWHNAGRRRWWETLTERFVYGVPWGSLVSILLVLLVYLFVQSGIESWSDPAVVPFRSWSYSYPLGMLAAGFTHAGSNHLLGNVLGALVLAPLVEYAWGHYPPNRGADTPETGYEHPPPGAPSAADRAAAADEGSDSAGAKAVFERPLVRAFVVFPVGIVVVSLLTSVFARGFSLGYSGTVFFFLGVAVVMLPLATIVAMVALTGLNVVVAALQTPILQVTADPGVPGPPGWVGINVQAHLLGFLLGVLVAVALLNYRNRLSDIDIGHLALALVLVVLSRSLWAYSTSSGAVFTRWQGVGVIFVLFLAAVIVAIVAVDDVQVAGPVTLRSIVIGGVVLITLLVALTSVPPNMLGMDDDPVPDTEGIDIEDYTVTYAENAPHGRVSANASGVIVVSEQRSIWTTPVRVEELRHSGEATVTVGGVGWREVVDIERSGWVVAGNDTVYAVALEHDDRRAEAFQSEPARADGRIAGHGLRVAATPGEFTLAVTYEGETVGETAIPPANESRTVDLAESAAIEELTVTTVERDGDARVLVEHDDTRVLVAEEETYN